MQKSTGSTIFTGTFRPFSSPGFHCGELSSARTASADRLRSGVCRTRILVRRPVVSITNETTTRGGIGGHPMTTRTFLTRSFTHLRNVRMSSFRNRGGVSQCIRRSESRKMETWACCCSVVAFSCPKAVHADVISRSAQPIFAGVVTVWPGTRRAVRRR